MSDTESRLDAALAQYDLVPLPDDFVRTTMSRIGAPSRRRPRLVDLALGASIAAFVTAIPVTWWSLNLVDPMWMAKAELALRGMQLGAVGSTTPTLLLIVVASGLALLSLPAMLLVTERRFSTEALRQDHRGVAVPPPVIARS